jgi:uncharacterized Zn finger protein
MKPWEYEWRRSTKQPAPEHGIKVKRPGSTWWGQRWLDALEAVLRGDAGRLARGRSYARAGRAHDLVVEHGRVVARVTGSRETPYEVSIELRELDEAAWTRAIAGLAEKAQFSAELLAGRMPSEIDEVFRAAGTSLFPRERADLLTSCTCPDSGDPCKHVAATHYVLGEALDRDPFLLFELRGRTKERVLAALRAARGATTSGSRPRRAKKKPAAAFDDASVPAIPKVSLGQIEASAYDEPRKRLPALKFSFEEPVAHGAMLRQLGAPTAWQGEQSLEATLAPVLRAAAETARRLVLDETETTASATERSCSSPARRRRSKRDSGAR